MGKKRKSLATSLDEVDRSMYSTFCNGANAISQLYSQAMNHQKISFQSGERHGLVYIYIHHLYVLFLCFLVIYVVSCMCLCFFDVFVLWI